MGGFASQVSKYAFGYAIAERLRLELVLDLSDYYRGYFRPYSLCYLEIPSHCIVTDQNDIKRIAGVREIKNSMDMQEMFKYPERGHYWINREEDDYRDFLNENRNLEICVDSKALLFFRLKKSLEVDFSKFFLEKVSSKNSVAVHIRRGDFVGLGWEDQEAFYEAAIILFSKWVDSVQFYFFSNDMSWVKKKFGTQDNFHFVSAARGNLGDVEELLCMAHCRYRILSRFSGYGILANIISSRWNKGGYAIMDGGKYEREIEGQNIELSRCLIYDKVIEYDKGGIYYLSSERIEQYSKYWGKKQGISDFNVLDILIRNLYRYRKIGNYYYVRECLESVDYPEVAGQNIPDWEQIYGISAKFSKPIYIITKEYKNYWRIEGLYLLALMLGRLGNYVYYLNCNPRSEALADKIEQAKNPDGKQYPFFCCYRENARKELLKEIPRNSIVITDLFFSPVLKEFLKYQTLIVLNKRGSIWLNFQKQKLGWSKKLNLALEDNEKKNSDQIAMPFDFWRLNEDRWLLIILRALELDGEKND